MNGLATDSGPSRSSTTALCSLVLLLATSVGLSQEFPPFFRPEQKNMEIRDPSLLPSIPVSQLPPPPTILDPQSGDEVRYLALDEAIGIALQNSEVVRVLAEDGEIAINSGQTIYDPAIVNNEIDRERAVFDPRVDVKNHFNRFETPRALQDPIFGLFNQFGLPVPPALTPFTDPSLATITGTRSSNYDLEAKITKKTFSGGRAQARVDVLRDRFHPGIFALNPQSF